MKMSFKRLTAAILAFVLAAAMLVTDIPALGFKGIAVYAQETVSTADAEEAEADELTSATDGEEEAEETKPTEPVASSEDEEDVSESDVGSENDPASETDAELPVEPDPVVVPTEFPENATGYIPDHQILKMSDEDYDSSLLKGTIPSSYSSVSNGYVTSVKDQNPYGTCWAFSTINSLESNAIIDGDLSKSAADLSELHLAYFTYNRPTDPLGLTEGDRIDPIADDYLDIGGNYTMAMYTLATGVGPVKDSVLPYSRASSSLSVSDSLAYANKALKLENVYEVSAGNSTRIKELVMEQGSVGMSYYHANGSSFYNSSNAAYYNYAYMGTNHAVSIVGWNDNYSKYNFSYTPSSNGAWLVKNSWGASWGNNGYFWMSYEDCAFQPDSDGTYNSVFAFDGESDIDEDEYIYQYDGGVIDAWYNCNVSSLKEASVYTAERNEAVTAASFVTYNENVSYSLQLYRNPDYDEPESGTAMLSKPITGTFVDAGYHTVEIPSAPTLEEGDTFSVVFTIYISGNKILVPVDYSVSYSNLRFVTNESAGQSYLNVGSRWIDFGWEYDATMRIKAFTTPADSVRNTVSITKQPTTAYAQSGAKASTSITATGDGLTYQWYYKKASQSSFSKSSITTNTYSVTMNSDYKNCQVYCVVKDQYGNTAKSNTVYLRMAATITTQPKTTYAASGAKASTSVAAIGDGLTYQWYYKKVGMEAFAKSSITSATYSVTMNEGYSGTRVYCYVTDKYGNKVKSDTVYLRMSVAITTQPKTTYAKSGAKATTSVTAIGDDLTYQWYYKKVGQTSFSKSSITSSTYSVTMNEDYSGTRVYCYVTDKYGNKVKSDTVYLRMSVSITTQPKTTYAASGAKAKTSVTAVGEDLTYQWYYKKPSMTSFSKSSIITNTYSVTMNSDYSNCQVYCVVTDKYGKTAKSSTVYLRMAVAITTQPKTTYAKAGTKASTTVKAAGDGLTYQWYYKKAGQTSFSKSAITSATYSVTMNSDYSNCQVYCVVTDKYGKTAKSSTVYLRMAVAITTQPKTVYVKSGSKATAIIKAEGDGLTYQWYYKKVGQSSFSKSAITTNTYAVTMNSDFAGAQIYCVVTDKYGKTVTSNKVYLKMAATITVQPKTAYAAIGSKAKTTVTAVGDGLSYQWYYKKPGMTAFSKSAIITNTYSVTMNEAYSGCKVYCIVSDKYGNTAKSSTVTLYKK